MCKYNYKPEVKKINIFLQNYYKKLQKIFTIFLCTFTLRQKEKSRSKQNTFAAA